MSSTNRGYKRHKSDYYVTPQKDIKVFLGEFVKHEAIKGYVLDPCAGGDEKHEMSYPTVLKECGFTEDDIVTIDIRRDSRADIIDDYRDISDRGDFNTIITNPPFKIALDVIKKALRDVNDGGFVIMLLRLNFLGTQKRFEFWQNNKPKYIFVHHKRMSFTDKGGTDSIEYAHFVWQKGYEPDFTKTIVI